MALLKTILNSKDDNVKPKNKSYWGCDLKVELVDVEKFRMKKNPTVTEVRALSNEFSTKELCKIFDEGILKFLKQKVHGFLDLCKKNSTTLPVQFLSKFQLSFTD